MCKILIIFRSTYYYEAKLKTDESDLTDVKNNVFKASCKAYMTHKIKRELV